LVVFPGYPSRIGCELIEGGVEPCRKNSFDVITIALDGLFTAVLPDQMRLEVTFPGLPESDARDRSGSQVRALVRPPSIPKTYDGVAENGERTFDRALRGNPSNV
jgi:hypothetical protein